VKRSTLMEVIIEGRPASVARSAEINRYLHTLKRKLESGEL